MSKLNPNHLDYGVCKCGAHSYPLGMIEAQWDMYEGRDVLGWWTRYPQCPVCASNLSRRLLRGHRIGTLSNLLAPGYSHCGKCRTNWFFVYGRIVMVPGTGSGCFALCEKCWGDLTPDERARCYAATYDEWERFGGQREYTRDELIAAVLAEKD